MRTLYIDITQLVSWHGKLTGIPRVMHELSSRFKDYDSAKFVVWDQTRFVLVDPAVFETRNAKQNDKLLTIKQPSLAKKVGQKVTPKQVRTGLKKLSSRKQSKVAKKETVPFSDKDTLFIMWGDWGSETYISKLRDLKQNKGINLVQISYDMLPIVTPQYSGHSTESLTNYVTKVYPICNLILAISNSTKNDVENWLHSKKLNTPRVEVFRLGDDFSFAKPMRPQNELFSKKSDFLLVVGTVEARKNHTLLYYVYKLAKSKGIKLPKLVVVGRRGWNTENVYELITLDPEVKNDIIFMHDTSDEELSWLYENCRFSIYPSLYEGWGLPIAESLSRGVPCVASSTSSMTEISDKGVLLFNPSSTDECLEAIIKLMDDKELIKLKDAAKSYKPTTWNESYTIVKRTIEEVS